MFRIVNMLPAVKRSGIQLLAHPLPSYRLRDYSTRPSFISRLVTNIKNEMEKNKEMSENLKKFREEAHKLEQSDALQSARKKFNVVESEASKSSEVLKGQLESLKGRVQDVLDEAGKTDLAKKAGQLSEELSKSARDVTDKISDSGKIIGQSGAFQSISETARIVQKEIDTQGIQGRVYKPLVRLRKRVDIPETATGKEKVFEANTEDTGIELHKDSKFYQSWGEL